MPAINDTTHAKVTTGSVWGWGLGTSGQIGDSTIISKNSPVSVIGTRDFITISQGATHAVALDTDGSAWAWGASANGRLGTNDSVNRSTPTSVYGGHTFTKISAGREFSAALRADGTVWAWGNNDYGQLGISSVTAQSTPTSAINAGSFIDIVCGHKHMLALRHDGILFACGYNDFGQLGINNVDAKSTLTQVYGTRSYTRITASGYGCSGALGTSGNAYCWGYNVNGAVGDGTTSARSTPTSVYGGYSFVDIQMGYNHAMGRKFDGTLYCWGENTYGTLGDNSRTGRNTPVSTSMPSGHRFIEIRSGDHFSVGLDEEGHIWTWGYNANYQLGIGATNTSKSVPYLMINSTRSFNTIFGLTNPPVYATVSASFKDFAGHTTWTGFSAGAVEIGSNYGSILYSSGVKTIYWRPETDAPSDDSDFVGITLAMSGDAGSGSDNTTCSVTTEPPTVTSIAVDNTSHPDGHDLDVNITL